MPSRTLSLFSLFSLQQGSKTKDHRWTQEVVWYGESRFREALLHIIKAEDRHQQWMQHYLQEETVSMIMHLEAF